ncbi:hypothetical protein CTAYLR_007382 [Chrysophaeum taylorii]|uniref:Uncharacterized protein n=1 Tax=Chrysophaeum taylorii TaxID=2483200 RepID=A0AAD7U6G9_9STRA|nr:hypothetical protein CTAYLR_007382 [Chrysophaeum taylorii]
MAFTDLVFTSEGVVKMSLVGGVLFILFVLFGPAPVDERKLELDREWARHNARGTFFHQLSSQLSSKHKSA